MGQSRYSIGIIYCKMRIAIEKTHLVPSSLMSIHLDNAYMMEADQVSDS